MATLAEKQRFAEQYVTAPDGRPFSLEGRDWVIDEFWLPLDGWKLWPVDETKLCDTCAAKANTLVEKYTAGDRTRTKVHSKNGCAGLKSEPVLIVALNLKRQQGKTFNTAAWCLARIFKDDNESIEMVAVAEEQVTRIFNKNYRRPAIRSKALSKRCTVRGTRITVPKKNSDFEVVATSLSAVSDTRTVVVVEEARAVPAKVAMAVIPTLFARGGWECPTGGKGHVRTHDGVDDANAPKKCSVCKKATQPWYGKTLLVSSAGELQDDDADWFAEFVEHYGKNPHPNVHVFRSTENLNPKVSTKQVAVFTDIFGNLDSTRTYADIEGANEFRRKGVPFMSESDITRIIDPRLGNEGGHGKPCVAFLDTSQTVEKTSWVVMADDTELSSDPWEYIYTSHVKVWLPEETGGIIDDEAVFRHLEIHLPMLPGLRRMLIDTAGRPWAVRLLKRLKALRARWTGKLEGIGKHHAESQQGWSVLEQRILTQRLRIQDVPGMMKEFRGVIRKRDAQGERPEKFVDRDRRRSHKDITENFATCCYLIQLEMMTGGGLGIARTHERATRTAANTGGVRVGGAPQEIRGLKALERIRAARAKNRGGGFRQTRGIDPNSL